MAQIVKTDVRETSWLKQRFEAAPDEICFPNRASKLRREDEIPRLGSRRSGFFFQSAKESRNRRERQIRPALRASAPPCRQFANAGAFIQSLPLARCGAFWPEINAKNERENCGGNRGESPQQTSEKYRTTAEEPSSAIHANGNVEYDVWQWDFLRRDEWIRPVFKEHFFCSLRCFDCSEVIPAYCMFIRGNNGGNFVGNVLYQTEK